MWKRLCDLYDNIMKIPVTKGSLTKDRARDVREYLKKAQDFHIRRMPWRDRNKKLLVKNIRYLLDHDQDPKMIVEDVKTLHDLLNSGGEGHG